MRKFRLSLCIFLLTALTIISQAQISLTGAVYTQDFNTLATSGSSTTVPTGWLFSESGTNANGLYTAGTGSSNTGDTYSFGATANTERAFGGLQSGALVPTIGASFINNTGATITSLDISYIGEQWRLGTSGRGADRLNFQYSLDATSLTTGTWTDVDGLDFSSPVTVGTVGLLNGNAAVNRLAISGSISELSLSPGATFYIRWTSFDASGADDGLSVDDFSITPNVTDDINLTINNVVQAESNAGTTSFIFTVSLSLPAETGGVTFDIATANNTAASPTDYISHTLTGQTIPEGMSSYTFTVQVNGDTDSEPDETFFVNITNPTGANLSDGQGLGTILNDDFCNPATHSIHEIQGNGNTSPIAGSAVTTSGIVTGLRSNGFFIQNPFAQYDVNTNTSEGIFVFTGSAPPPTVVIGNNVCVSGNVTEFIPSNDPNSPSTTEIITPVVNLLSTGNPLPPPVILNSSDTDPSGGIYQLEKYEGMRVQVNSLTVVAPTEGNISESNATANSTGYFYGVITGINRPFREPGIQLPDPLPAGAPATVPRWDANPELLGVASLAQPGSTVINVATGALVTNITGPLDFTRRYYTIDVDAASPHLITNNSLTFAPVPNQTPEELTVASFNMQRFYDQINDPGGDVTVSAAAYSNRLNKVSLAIRNVLRFPDIIGVVEVEKLSVLQDIANKINNDAIAAVQPNPNYQAYLAEGNDPGGIDVGFLVKTPRVSVIDVIQYGKTTTYIDPNDGSTDILNDRPPLVLRALFNQPGCASAYPVTVIVNHLRSLNDIDDPVDGNRVRVKRRTQAEYLANLIQEFQTDDPAAHIISVGDYNAFQFNDGFVDLMGTIKGTPSPATDVVLASPDLVNPDLINLIDTHTPDQRYSYSFMGTAQVLDHILVNENLSGKVSRFSVARLNADFPEIVRNDAARPERISDHDAAVAYILFTDGVDPVAVCQNTTVTLANGTASITANDVDGGSTDNCAIQTLSVSKSTFDCTDIGNNNVILTVTDMTGNTSTCTAVVTVVGEIPSCSIVAVPANNIYTGGVATNIYLGYGPQSVTLDLTPSGGSGFTYSWSGNGTLSCTDCQDPVFSPSAQGVYEFTATVTNNYGCSTTCTITICVLDIRVPGTNGNKVYICHVPSGHPGAAQTLAINVSNVSNHIPGHADDRLGKCNEDPCSTSGFTTGRMIQAGAVPEKINKNFSVSVSPNPSASYFTLSIQRFDNSPVTLTITDAYGRIISKNTGILPGSGIRIGTELLNGIYFAEISNGRERKVVKLVKMKN